MAEEDNKKPKSKFGMMVNRASRSAKKGISRAGQQMASGAAKYKSVAVEKIGNVPTTPEDQQITTCLEQLKDTKNEIYSISDITRNLYEKSKIATAYLNNLSKQLTESSFETYSQKFSRNLSELSAIKHQYLQTMEKEFVIPLETFATKDIEKAQKLKVKYINCKTQFDIVSHRFTKAKSANSKIQTKIDNARLKQYVAEKELTNMRYDIKTEVKHLEAKKNVLLLQHANEYWMGYLTYVKAQNDLANGVSNEEKSNDSYNQVINKKQSFPNLQRYDSYNFQAPPLSFVQQQQQHNIYQQYQQYQYMNNYNQYGNQPTYSIPSTPLPRLSSVQINQMNTKHKHIHHKQTNSLPDYKQFKPLPMNPLPTPIQNNTNKKYKKHRHKHKKKHRNKKHITSDSPPPPPPPSDTHYSQFTRRRGISGDQPVITQNTPTVSSHLKLIGGRNGQKCTMKSTETIKFLVDVLLSQVLFSSMKDRLSELINVMYKIQCPINECIIKQNEFSDTYFIIESGAFDIILENKDKKIKKIGEICSGKTFSDGSLLYSTPSAATLKATQLSIVWALDAMQFRDIRSKQKTVPQQKIYQKPLPQNNKNTFRKYQNLIHCKLSDFKNIGILGVGSFGRVSLVKSSNTGITYSLKKIRKNKIIETKQQKHIKNERQVLALLKSDFCVKLFGVYQDTFNIYFLMEPILGGEIFTILRWNKQFSEKTARFYAACVILAFEHLHGLNIIYRDLKPENLLISNNGYCKLVDFGFAKKINNSCTLCGTPDYLSPEIIQNDQQTVAVDWWTLGIFVYEMIIGHVPFSDDINGNIKMYEKILTYDVEFDVQLSPRVEHLISVLLDKNPSHRLGSINDCGSKGTQQVLNHPWFHGFDWNKMRIQQIAPPYIPEINGTDDLQYFEECDDENINEQLLSDPNAYDWCKDF